MKSGFLVAATLLATTGAHAEMFNGGYVGAQAGYERNSVNSADLFKGAGYGTASVDKKSVSGASLGLIAGYDYKAGDQFVVGGELAATFSTSSNKQTVTFSGGGGVPANTKVAIEYKSNATFEVTARAGVLASENVLVYLRGGYVNSKLKATIPNAAIAPIKGNNNGFMFGGGVEAGISEKISARLEARYFDFKGPISRTQVVAGIAYHF